MRRRFKSIVTVGMVLSLDSLMITVKVSLVRTRNGNKLIRTSMYSHGVPGDTGVQDPAQVAKPGESTGFGEISLYNSAADHRNTTGMCLSESINLLGLITIGYVAARTI